MDGLADLCGDGEALDGANLEETVEAAKQSECGHLASREFVEYRLEVARVELTLAGGGVAFDGCDPAECAEDGAEGDGFIHDDEGAGLGDAFDLGEGVGDADVVEDGVAVDGVERVVGEGGVMRVHKCEVGAVADVVELCEAAGVSDGSDGYVEAEDVGSAESGEDGVMPLSAAEVADPEARAVAQEIVAVVACLHAAAVGVEVSIAGLLAEAFGRVGCGECIEEVLFRLEVGGLRRFGHGGMSPQCGTGVRRERGAHAVLFIMQTRSANARHI